MAYTSADDIISQFVPGQVNAKAAALVKAPTLPRQPANDLPTLKAQLAKGLITHQQFITKFPTVAKAPVNLNPYSIRNIAGGVGIGVKDTTKGIGEAAINTGKAPLNALSLGVSNAIGAQGEAAKSRAALAKSANNSFISPLANVATLAGVDLAAHSILNNPKTSPAEKTAQLQQAVNPTLHSVGFDLNDKGARQKLKEAGLVGLAASIPLLSKGGFEGIKGATEGLTDAKSALTNAKVSTLSEALNRTQAQRDAGIPVPKSALDNHVVEKPAVAGKSVGENTNAAKTTTSEPLTAPKTVEMTTSTTKVPKPSVAQSKPSQEGFVDPGAAIKDAKALIDKHQQSVKFNGDIREFAAGSEGAKGNLLNDAAKLIKNRTQISNADKKVIQDYRDAKAAGQTPAPLPAHLQKIDEETTAFAKAKQEADVERAKLEGNLQKAKQLAKTSVDSYTHRAAQGKGSAYDYVLQNDRKNPLSVGMGKTTAADKARNIYKVTDEDGNSRTVSIKTQTGKDAKGQKFIKPNQVVAISKGGKESELLGSLKSKTGIDGKTFTGKDGKTYTIGQAGASDITRDVGTKYYVDPHLNNMAAYLDSRVALENARLFDNIKKSPLSEKFMSEPDTTAPKGWKSVPGLDQFRGYKFEPRTADALHDIFVRNQGNPDVMDKVSNFLRQSIVYFPVKHDFNIASAYAIDRGLSNFVNPLALKRMVSSLYQATQDVTHNTAFYQELAKKGFDLTTNDRHAFEQTFGKELNKLVDDKPFINGAAKAIGTSPVRLYKAIQRVSVWDVQDIANIARVRERMMAGPLKKADNLDTAIKQSQRFGFQYQVPEKVAGSRTASNLLQSKPIFFGKYRYDQFKILKNIMKDSLKITDPKKAAQAWDKMAALLVVTFVLWPEVDKGVQKLTGNKNAYISAPGPAGVVETANKVRTGKEDVGTAVSNQAYIGPLQTALDLKANHDSFTGDQIRDPNTSAKQQGADTLAWLKKQYAPTEKIGTAKNATSNSFLTAFLEASGTNLPKNSPLANKLNSLKFDTLPNVQKTAKSKAGTGDLAGAMSAINQYDQTVLKAAKSDLQSQGVPIPDDQTLIKQLKKSGIYYQPKQTTIKSWTKPKKATVGGFNL